MDQLPRLGKRELICLLSFTCNYVVFVWRGFLFLWVLGMGYVILLWHSLSLTYNYFDEFEIRPDPTSGFHGNRQGYDGKNSVSTFSRLFFIRSFLYLQAIMTCMRARTSLNFGLIGPPIAELAALESLKKSP